MELILAVDEANVMYRVALPYELICWVHADGDTRARVFYYAPGRDEEAKLVALGVVLRERVRAAGRPCRLGFFFNIDEELIVCDEGLVEIIGYARVLLE